MVNVVCIKQGRLYGPEYVNRLRNSLGRHATQDFRFMCFTDSGEGIDPAIEQWPIPYSLRGWWCKIPLFAPPQCIENGQIVAIDLDVVVVGNIDWLLDWRGDFMVMGTNSPKYYNGSLWSLRPGACTHVWENFIHSGAEAMRTHYSDQEWISEQVPGAPTVQELFPGKVLGYNTDYANKPEPKFNGGASIYVFHGFPKPSEAAKTVDWVRENWR